MLNSQTRSRSMTEFIDMVKHLCAIEHDMGTLYLLNQEPKLGGPLGSFVAAILCLRF